MPCEFIVRFKTSTRWVFLGGCDGLGAHYVFKLNEAKLFHTRDEAVATAGILRGAIAPVTINMQGDIVYTTMPENAFPQARQSDFYSHEFSPREEWEEPAKPPMPSGAYSGALGAEKL